jgi:hypothetical protein
MLWSSLNTICLFFLALSAPFISRDARIAPSSRDGNDSKITAHIVFI